MNGHLSPIPRPLAGLALGLALLGHSAPASAQHVTRPGYSAPAYRPSPRYATPAPAYRTHRGQYALPYNKSPYTDDWSTARHLSYPKPWMLPTRDPAHRGR